MPTPPARSPKSVTVGTGSDKIVLKISQDWYVNDAQYNIVLDGTQVGATQTVSAYQANGQYDTVTVLCGLTDASHTVRIDFLNNAGNGGAGNGNDMNIFVIGATYNGVTIPNVNLTLYDENWPNTITFNPVNLLPARTAKSVTLGTGSDALVFQITQSWYLTDAIYNVYIDGVQVGTNQTVSSIRSAGSRDTVTVRGNWSTGNHTCAVNFVNDANDAKTYVVANWHDRIIYITTARINGIVVPNSTLNIGAPASPHTFTFTKDANTIPNNPPTAVMLGTGVNSIVMHVSQDWYQTNCQYTVKVDGTQIGGTVTASGIMAQNVYDTVTVKGAFPAGSHTLTVTLTNDGWDGTQGNGHDRNVYVRSVTFNGTAVAGSDLDVMDGATPMSFTFQGSGGSSTTYPSALTALGITTARMTFNDEFDAYPDISYDTNGTKWTITPYNGSGATGEAWDTYDPANGIDAFSVSNSILTIKMFQSGGHWVTGIMYSVHPNQSGFAQRYGYFECRMKMPDGPGVWPAFWLNGTGQSASPASDHSLEIDVIEYYGHEDGTGYLASHNEWLSNGDLGDNYSDWIHYGERLPSNIDLRAGFHTYGVLWEPQRLRFYFDNVLMSDQTYPNYNADPACVIIDNALGGGWDTSQTIDPNYLEVDWVRVWQLPQY